MAKNRDQLNRQVNEKDLSGIFTTLKVLILFFCFIPVTSRAFTPGDGQQIFSSFMRLILLLAILLVVAVFWFLLNKTKTGGNIWLKAVEILLMYGTCVFCYSQTGYYASNYKVLFELVMLVYSMDFGIKSGLILGTISCGTILVGDLVTCPAEKLSSYFQADFLLSTAFFLVAYIVGDYVYQSKKLALQLRDYANRDGLTGMYNHRCFHDRLNQLMAAKKENLYLFIVDIDHFKVYNDTLGHLKGDEVLKTIKNILNEMLDDRSIFRYGGEEFTVILTGIDDKTAAETAERIRRRVEDYVFEGEELMPGHNLTVSIGVSGAKEDDTPADLIERADNALYKAKFFKRNRVEVYSSVFERFEFLDCVKDDEKIISIKALLSVINSRDRYTYNHTDRVVHYCEIFAKYLGLSDDMSRTLLYSAYLHDIGKINIPQEILISEKKLTEAEWAQMKRHPRDGADIVRKNEAMGDVADIIQQHHERYDGRGYPDGVKGENIHYLARILTLADCFDAMTAKRPYQKSKTFEEALTEIHRCAGTQFDPVLAEKFIEAIHQVYN